MLENLWLFIRNVAMIILFPGTVTVYIPYQLLTPITVSIPDAWSLPQYAAALLLIIGTAILIKSIWSFASVGRGTLAPFDETNRLIVVGLYRYVRNPMYVGVMLILFAESWFFWSSRLLIYTGICFVVANILVIGYEENRLKYKYGDDFRRYCEHVGRWIPGKPYDYAG
jgi:protein-S-isoprenylcysteine O-methyltransferase Ste14